MVRKCCACFKGCGAGEKITLHKFPKDPFVRSKWVNAIDRKNFAPSNTSVLCSRHFTPECFTYGKSGQQKRVFIKPHAVPTLFPPIMQSRRSLMRSNLAPLTNTECSDIGFHLSQSSGPEEYVIKQEPQTYTDTNTSEAFMSIESTENAVDMDYLKEQESSIDWVEHFDQSNDSIAHIKEQNESMDWTERYDRINDSLGQLKRESNPESCPEEQKESNKRDTHEFKSRRRILKNLNLALSCIAAQRKELKIVKQKNRLLEKRLSILKALLTHVLSEKILSDDDNDSESESESEIWSG